MWHGYSLLTTWQPQAQRVDASRSWPPLAPACRARLVMTPSQSEGLDGCEQPQGLPGLKFNHSLELAVLVRSLGIKLLLISDVLPNLFLLKSHSRDRVASCPKPLPIKIPFPCSKLPSHRNCRFPLEVSNHLSNGVLWGNPY